MSSTTTDTIGAPARPAGFTFWAAAVSVLAAVALIMSAVALTVAASDRVTTGVASADARGTSTVPWDDAKLDAMEGRMLAETLRSDGAGVPWDDAKLDAMEGRMLAETLRSDG